MIKLGFKKVHPDAKLPEYAHVGDAGMDVYAVEDTILNLGIPKVVKVGLVADIPDGYELQVRPRSGLSVKGVTVWNAPGTIDSNYRGEIGVILMYLNNEVGSVYNMDGTCSYTPKTKFNISKGDRIAQLVLAPVTKAEIYEVREVSQTDRGEGGFGSTGV